MKKYILLFTLVALSSQNILLAQVGEREWSRGIGESLDASRVGEIQQTLDGGYIYTWFDMYPGYTYSIVEKLDKYGRREWSIFMSVYDIAYSLWLEPYKLVALTVDSGYVIDGPVLINDIRYEESGRFKLNSAGEVEYPYIPEPTLPWQNDLCDIDLNLKDNESLGISLKTSDGGCIAAVSFFYSPFPEEHFKLSKFSGPAQSFAISGYLRDNISVGISEVAVTFSNGGATVVTDANGYYVTSVSNGWSGTSTASKSGYTFNPANYSYSAVSTDQTNQNYSGTKANSSVSIAGYVRDGTGNPLSGVAVTFSNGGATVYSDVNGHYYTSVSSGWGGTSSALLTDWNFNPSNYSYSSLIVNTEDQDYSGNQISLGIADYETSPAEFTLKEAYPNPFNPSTTIDYYIPLNPPSKGDNAVGGISLQIYDITGKLINTLIDQVQPSGWHSVQWNGKDQVGANVPAGAYLVRVKAGTDVRHTKVMLLK